MKPHEHYGEQDFADDDEDRIAGADMDTALLYFVSPCWGMFRRARPKRDSDLIIIENDG